MRTLYFDTKSKCLSRLCFRYQCALRHECWLSCWSVTTHLLWNPGHLCYRCECHHQNVFQEVGHELKRQVRPLHFQHCPVCPSLLYDSCVHHSMDILFVMRTFKVCTDKTFILTGHITNNQWTPHRTMLETFIY